jgi:hypothetical protein
MENDDVTVVISERSTANLREVQERQLAEKRFRYDRSNVVSRAQRKKETARLNTWLVGVSAPAEKQFSKDDFLMEISATDALDCFEDRVKKQQARVIALNKAKAQQKEEKRHSAQYLRHPETKMKIFFENAANMSTVNQSSIDSDDKTESAHTSLPNGIDTDLLINEIDCLDVEREQALLKAENTACSFAEGNPLIQRADVSERMWVLVSDENPAWKACCSMFTMMKKKANTLHRQLAACKNCATVFFPFFPADCHLHQLSDRFKGCVDSRSSNNDSNSLSRRALVSLAHEAGAYKKEGEDEYIKLIRMVRGTRDNKGGVKYGRIELCENSNVAFCESASKVILTSHNLAVGILKLVIQLHFKVPIRSKFLRPDLPGAGFAEYFQRYRHFVPEFADEILFRCFLVEFGRHVKRTDNFDHGFMSKSDWWSGRSVTPESTFASSGSFGMLIKLDKAGLVQLAKSLADGTGRVLDDFCRYNANEDFLSCPSVDENADLEQYLEQMPERVEPDNELDQPEDKELLRLLPLLNPLRLADHPEVRDAEMANKVSKTKLAKRPPDLDEHKRLQRDRKKKNQADYAARKKAEKEAFQLLGKLRSQRSKLIVKMVWLMPEAFFPGRLQACAILLLVLLR